MAQILLPRRFKLQPQRHTAIDFDIPISQSLSFAFNPAAGVWDEVTHTYGNSTQDSGSPPYTIDAFGGISRKYTAANFNRDEWTGISDAAGSKTVAVLVSWSSASPSLDAPFMKGGFNLGWGFKTNSSGQMRLVSSASSIVITDSTAIAAKKLYLFVGVFDGANVSLYKNGVLVGTLSDVGGVGNTAGSILTVGRDQTVSAGSNANVYGAWVWERALTAAQVTSFSDNPWQIYRRQLRRLLLGIPGAMPSFRALILSGGEIAQITDAQVGTGEKPIVWYNGQLQERSASEGTPLIWDGTKLRLLDTAAETLTV